MFTFIFLAMRNKAGALISSSSLDVAAWEISLMSA
jgi:hypothetical protein